MSAEGSPRELEPERSGPSGRLKAKQGAGFSYAAIGLYKGKPPPDAKGDRQAAEDCGLSVKPSQSSISSRTAPSRENAMLRAEVDVLRQQVKDLTDKLRSAEAETAMKLGHASRRLTQQNSTVREELGALKEALQSADAGGGSGGAAAAASAAVPTSAPAAARATAALASTPAVLAATPGIRQTLEAALLRPSEVEAAALQCCWLARYWGLAAKLGLFPEVAATQAAHWAALAPPAGAMQESARHLHRQLRQARRKEASARQGDAGPASAGLRVEYSQPAWMKSTVGRFSSSMQVTVADLLVVEAGLRQLGELGVEAAVMGALAEQARMRRLTCRLPGAVPEGSGLAPVAADPEEAEELAFQAAALAHTWGRAAARGLEPGTSGERCDAWVARLEQRQPCLRDFENLRRGFQEMRLLGVEQQLWHGRHGE